MPLILLAALAGPADAAELVWLDDDPSAEDLAAVRLASGLDGEPRSAEAFRAAATDLGSADTEAWAALEVALKEVRPFETRLDGELVIMEELDNAIAALPAIPDAAARDALFSALAYQGFAVDRFFVHQLGEDERAEGMRVLLPDGTALPRPWVDAVALDPSRDVTPYEIAEAAQRANFATVKQAAGSLLPGRVALEGELPAGSSLVLDGVPVDPGPTGRIRVRPGQHFVHVVRSGHVLARAKGRVDVNGTLSIGVSLDDATWNGWLEGIRAGKTPPPPPELSPSLQAWDGEVVVAWQGAKGPQAVRVTEGGVASLDVDKALRAAGGRRSDDGGVQVQIAAGVGAGWLSSGDFYAQDPANVPREVASVNAATVDVMADVSVQVGLFRASVLGDFGIPFGEHHVAFTGDDTLRFRPDVSVALGVKYAQVMAGYLFPHHPSVGARATIPAYKGLEVLAVFRAGLPTTSTRDDGTEWTSLPVWQAWAGIGYRFGVRVSE